MQLEALLPDVELNVFGVSDVAMLHALRLTVIDFLNRTQFWEVTESHPLVENQAQYTVTPPPNTRMVEITEASYEETPIKTVRTMLPSGLADYGKPERMHRSGVSGFTLYPTPDGRQTGAVGLKYFVVPTYDATEVDNAMLFDLFREHIVAGTTARLLSGVGKEWSNPGAAASFTAWYNKGVYEAVKYRKRYATKEPLNVRYGI